MKKIYLVNFEDGYDYVNTFAYCSTLEIAEREKERLKDRIEIIKTQYYLEYDRDYDKDLEEYHDTDIDELTDEYEELCRRVLLFKAKYPEINYTDIFIKEEDLL